MSYNGWKNYETWNIALWIGNDEPLYREAVRFMRSYTGSSPYRDFIEYCELSGSSTPDNVNWLTPSLDWERLDEMMMEFAPEPEDDDEDEDDEDEDDEE